MSSLGRGNASIVIIALLLILTLSTCEMGIQAISPLGLVSIYLESEEIDGSTSNLGTITFDPEPYPGYSLPTTIQRETAPFYQAAYYPPSRHVIDHWELSGGIHLVPPQNHPESPLISVEVTGSGTLRAVYVEIFDINLESREDNGATSNLGSIALPSSGPSYSLPKVVGREWGTYEATYYPASSYSIDRWETSGGVSVPDPYVGPTTSVTVTGDGTLRAVYTQSGEPPSPPLDLTATTLLHIPNTIILSWQEPLDQGSSEIVEYKIYRGYSSGSETPHDSIYAPFLSLRYDDLVMDDNLYYYYVTAVNNDGLESPSSNRIKSSRMESLKGIQSVVHLNEVHTNGYKEFSIQQNFWINDTNQRIWAQNVVVVNTTTDRMYGTFQAWDYTSEITWPLILPWLVQSHWSDFTNDLTFYSVIDGDALIMKNNFASIDYPLAPNSHIESWPAPDSQIEIVLVGSYSWPGLPSTVQFLPTTEGYIDNYVRIGAGSWLHGANTVLSVELKTTPESSSGLQFDWPLPGDFQSTLGWSDQGYRFEPDYSRELASPPELPIVPEYFARLVVDAHCPVNLHLFDDLGRHLGFNASSGLLDYGIPNSTMHGSEDAQYAIVFGPEGYYRIWVEGTDEGNYTLTEYVANSTSSVSTIGNYTGSVTNGSSTSYGLSITNGTGSSGIPGDINLDGKTDTADLSFVATRFGLERTNPFWNATADIFPDNLIDIRDVFNMAVHYGETLEATLFEDGFDYETLEEMESAGWIVVNEAYTSVGNGYVVLDNDGSTGTSIVYRDFSPGIYEWRAESKGMWIGRSYGSLNIGVETERHNYRWWGDGYYDEFVFTRDGVKVLRFPGYSPELNAWSIFTLERIENTFYMYWNGTLQNIYTETDENPSALTGVIISSSWTGTTKYDYISVTTPQD